MTDAPNEIHRKKPQELFLPVHGYVFLHPEEIAIIDHPSFQRLRRCRQLGFAHFVFPGATHTRFEHSIGAVHVAQRIVDSINRNAEWHIPATPDDQVYLVRGISEATTRLIRVGALLHDIGHVPAGHTLEDELSHLPKHDGTARLSTVSDAVPPGADLSLCQLVNSLYEAPCTEVLAVLAAPRPAPFDVVKMIVSKEPKLEEGGRDVWLSLYETLSKCLPLRVCRDIVGNTICADFLDYLFRDWHHIGKPLREDERLYQYLEVRVLAPHGASSESPGDHVFIINTGPDQKRRDDSAGAVLELLDARYKLAATVLFHRTKLALTALLDRCFLELRRFYQEARLGTGISPPKPPADYLANRALDLLLKHGDDQIPDIVERLSRGVCKKDADALKEAAKLFVSRIDKLSRENPDEERLGELPMPSIDVTSQQELIIELATRLRNRVVYTQGCRIAFRDLGYEEQKTLLERYARPVTRLQYLSQVEMRFEWPPGSVLMYCPPDPDMNAKVAETNLLIDGRVMPFREHEEHAKENERITGGALNAQIERFRQLWGITIYVERSIWNAYAEDGKIAVRDILRKALYLRKDEDPKLQREMLEVPLQRVRAKAFPRGNPNAAGSNMPIAVPGDSTFPSGLPYGKPSEEDSK